MFWKLLLAFWVAFFVISQLFWVLVTLPATDRTKIEITPLSAPPSPLNGSDAVVERQVRGSDGSMFRVRYHYKGARRILTVPVEPLVLALVFGPIFGVVMAWYLVAPIRRLRQGFERLSAGDLSVRLVPGMGRRHDEIADLARDFDVMASQLEQSIQGREQLLHDVSHELRSPLSRLQLAIALARQDRSQVDASLDRIEYEGRRLDSVVRELLSLARAESENSPGEDYFDLAALLESVLADARFEAEAAGVGIVSDIEAAGAGDSAPSLRGNTELVRWALDNVVRNALRFSTRGQRVHVKLAYDEATARYEIDIVDEGPGAPESVLPTLFEPFVRADETNAGFGLGLAVAKRAVSAQGGTIEASNRPSAGLGVHITLPAGRFAVMA
ncbi:sensor histidine kinase [Novosphingobium sp. Rr 2-17]|uniref:sensor histidine kinase n=1 Tax=Novosphingobium sp. Rr 2-17 TaxID=555793 RepID=UPI001ED92F70|nr:ATP-binding protein [Novosphingobium sp. Rr 2-17]